MTTAGPTDETPCVQAGGAAAAVTATTTATRATSRTRSIRLVTVLCRWKAASPILARLNGQGGDPVPACRRPEPLRRRGGHERLLHACEHFLARSLLHRLQAAELEARQLDAAFRAHRQEAEVGEEARREDRAVHVEALEVRLALGVAIRERLERAGAALAHVADRGEEERLHHPRTGRVGEVGARDEDGIVARRPRRQLAGARKELRRPVLHRAEQAPVVVVVDRPPRTPLVLGRADPLALVGATAVPRLPPDAFVADRRRRLERRAREA